MAPRKAIPQIALLNPRDVRAFRRKIFSFYRTHRRDLPFRNTTEPYEITVSELMLQQTQVERVVEKYLAWVERWPDWHSLAAADRKSVLAAWQGLGYNRRAVFLHTMARTIVTDYSGVMPHDEAALRRLPGIGPYTARAIRIFAFGRQDAAIDTNIRRVLIHELKLPLDISPADLEAVARSVLPRGRARDWHYALMDYSRLALPRSATRVRPLSRQSRFDGSLRQIRGEIVRRLSTARSVRLETIARDLGRTIDDVRRAAAGLERDGLVQVKSRTVRLSE